MVVGSVYFATKARYVTVSFLLPLHFSLKKFIKIINITERNVGYDRDMHSVGDLDDRSAEGEHEDGEEEVVVEPASSAQTKVDGIDF